MKLKLFAIVGSAALAAALLGSTLGIGCATNGCLRDDPAVHAEEVVIPMLLLYTAMSWLTVYSAMLALRTRFEGVMSCGLAALAFAVAASGFLHSSSVDGAYITTVSHLVPWLAAAWFSVGLVAVGLWPNPALQPTAATDL